MFEEITGQSIEIKVVDGKLEISQLDPAEFDVSKADELVATVSDGVLMVGTREVIGEIILGRIRSGLQEAGVTTQDLIETGEKIREELYEETYGKKAK